VLFGRQEPTFRSTCCIGVELRSKCRLKKFENKVPRNIRCMDLEELRNKGLGKYAQNKENLYNYTRFM
jgi:hypothetical protein